MPTTSLPPATGVSAAAAVVAAPPDAVVAAPPPDAVVPALLPLSSLPHAAASTPKASNAPAMPKTARRDLPDDRCTLPPLLCGRWARALRRVRHPFGRPCRM